MNDEPAHDPERLGAPPEASPAAHRWMRRLVTPVEAFLHVEAASGVALLVAAAAALALANSSWGDAYHRVLEAPVGLRLGSLVFERPLHFWVNDGLMTIFFFVVGLEVRREIHGGELSTPRGALLPAAAAVGGMALPALLYLLVAGHDPVTRRGWGVPMATDIAFAVGVLALLGKRVPPALRVLLLALAIIDDIGAILVIALFYSEPLEVSGLVLAGAGVAGIVLLQRIGARRPLLYLVPGIVLWAGVLRSGVHPTIAGVIVGLLTPARSWLGPTGMASVARRSAEQVERDVAAGGEDAAATERLAQHSARIDVASREALAPAARLQLRLHPWVAFVIMPVFALANAGVTLDASAASATALGAGIVVGLVLGKPLGILTACFVVVRLRVAALPRGLGWRELSVLGVVAGVGFTMSIFVAALAFPGGVHLERAKAAILTASATAMALGLVIGRAVLRPEIAKGAAATASEAERSEAL